MTSSEPNYFPKAPTYRYHHTEDEGFSGWIWGEIWMWELDHKEGESWRIDAFKLWCCKSLLRVSWTARKSNQSIPKEINPEYLLERLMLKLKLISVLWPCDVKSRLIGEDPDAGKDWRQKEKRVAGDEMVGWHHWLHGHEFEQTAGDGEGQGSLACCSPWGHKESDMT